MTEPIDFTDRQLERYARHIILEEIGEEGQARLMAGSVLMVGAGGLGAPALLYLAAAGVGRIGIVDNDTVDLSNLQRQVIHRSANLGTPKTASAAKAIADLNDEVDVISHNQRLTAETAPQLVHAYDVIIDGSDNFSTRFALNDACRRAGRPLIVAALSRFEGEITTLVPDGPCYRCLYPTPPPDGAVPRCDEAGIIGALAGTIGCLQALEAVKLMTGAGETLVGRVLHFDAFSGRFRETKLRRSASCPICSRSEDRRSVDLQSANVC